MFQDFLTQTELDLDRVANGQKYGDTAVLDAYFAGTDPGDEDELIDDEDFDDEDDDFDMEDEDMDEDE